jgi:hypothetical protein
MSYANYSNWRPGHIVEIRDDLGNQIQFMLGEFHVYRDGFACHPIQDWVSEAPVPKFVSESPDGSIGWIV